MFVRTRRNLTNGGNATVPFVKLDCGMLTSTIWDDYPARSLFITSLLMMEPKEYREPVDQIEVRTLDNTGWSAPPDWYGFVPAAGIGIIKRAGDVEIEEGFAALERLGSPDPTSRSQDYEGRRLIRVDGGYLVLNFDKYRERDYGAAERMRRLRERRRVQANGVTVPQNVTQAEADTEPEEDKGIRSREAQFLFCWGLYPRKLGKSKAWNSFRRQVHTTADFEAFRQAIENYKHDIATLGTSEQFIKHGSTFFHEGWKDYVAGVWKPAAAPRLPGAPVSKPAEYRPLPTHEE